MERTIEPTFKILWLGLTEERKEAFAVEAGTTAGYIQTHLIHGSKLPRPDLMAGLARACAKFDWPFTEEQLVLHFYRKRAAA